MSGRKGDYAEHFLPSHLNIFSFSPLISLYFRATIRDSHPQQYPYHTIFLYTANTAIFLTLLVAIAWALATGLMAKRERGIWLEGGETARMASVLLGPKGGFWDKGWGVGAGGWGQGGEVERLKRRYLWYKFGDHSRVFIAIRKT